MPRRGPRSQFNFNGNTYYSITGLAKITGRDITFLRGLIRNKIIPQPIKLMTSQRSFKPRNFFNSEHVEAISRIPSLASSWQDVFSSAT